MLPMTLQLRLRLVVEHKHLSHEYPVQKKSLSMVWLWRWSIVTLASCIVHPVAHIALSVTIVWNDLITIALGWASALARYELQDLTLLLATILNFLDDSCVHNWACFYHKPTLNLNLVSAVYAPCFLFHLKLSKYVFRKSTEYFWLDTYPQNKRHSEN